MTVVYKHLETLSDLIQPFCRTSSSSCSVLELTEWETIQSKKQRAEDGESLEEAEACRGDEVQLGEGIPGEAARASGMEVGAEFQGQEGSEGDVKYLRQN